MRYLLAVPLLLTACATSSELPSARTDRSVVTVQTTGGSGNQMQMELTREADINSAAIDATVADAWAALPPVFEGLGLPVTGADNTNHAISSVQRVRRIGGKSPATYFRCPGPYGNLASSGDVYISLRAQVLPAESGSGSTLRTEVEAKARASTGGNQVQCSANSQLPDRIAEMLKERLGNM